MAITQCYLDRQGRHEPAPFDDLEGPPALRNERLRVCVVVFAGVSDHGCLLLLMSPSTGYSLPVTLERGAATVRTVITAAIRAAGRTSGRLGDADDHPVEVGVEEPADAHLRTPPETSTFSPVTQRRLSETSAVLASAVSSGCPTRPSLLGEGVPHGLAVTHRASIDIGSRGSGSNRVKAHCAQDRRRSPGPPD